MSINDGVREACFLFRETMDYATYINHNGCNFGHFSCCKHVNNTILEEYASVNCGMSDVCGYEASPFTLANVLLSVSLPVIFLVAVLLYVPSTAGLSFPSTTAYTPIPDPNDLESLGESQSMRNARQARTRLPYQ